MDINNLPDEEKTEQDALALAQLIYDIYKNKKATEVVAHEQQDNE